VRRILEDLETFPDRAAMYTVIDVLVIDLDSVHKTPASWLAVMPRVPAKCVEFLQNSIENLEALHSDEFDLALLPTIATHLVFKDVCDQILFSNRDFPTNIISVLVNNCSFYDWPPTVQVMHFLHQLAFHEELQEWIDQDRCARLEHLVLLKVEDCTFTRQELLQCLHALNSCPKHNHAFRVEWIQNGRVVEVFQLQHMVL